MKPLKTLLAVAFLALGVAACGRTTAQDGRSHDTATAASAVRAATARTSSRQTKGEAQPGTATVAGRPLEGDEDDDDTAAELARQGPADQDNDTDNDYVDNARKGYRDGDDGVIAAYGHAPSSADARALTTLAKRYFSAAAGGDGARACSMIIADFVRSIPEDYGQPPGPIYLRGKTCAVVMSRLFEHDRASLASPIEVTGVRVNNSQAHIFVGSPTLSARIVLAERRRGAWKVVGLLGTPVP
jgi:hypothetical protein